MTKEELDEIETYLKEKVSDKGFDFILQIVEKDKETNIISNIKDENRLLEEFSRVQSYYLDLKLKNTIVYINKIQKLFRD